MIRKYIIIITLILAVFLVFGCDETKTSANINEYLSSDILKLIPSNSSMVMKVNSIEEIYDYFEISYIEELIDNSKLEDIKENLGFSPFDKDKLSDYTGIDVQKRIICAIYGVEDTTKINTEAKLNFILALPLKDEAKFKSLIENSNEKQIDNVPVFYKDEDEEKVVFFFKNDYVFINISLDQDIDTALEKVKAIINLPVEKSIANSENYKELMKKMKAKSIANFYIDGKRFSTTVIVLCNKFLHYMNYMNYMNTDMFDSIKFDSIPDLHSIMDLYFTDKTIELSFYTTGYPPSEIKVNEPDIMKKLPHNPSLVMHFDISPYIKYVDVDWEEYFNNYINYINSTSPYQNIDIDIDSIMDKLGVSFDELFNSFRGDMGMAIVDLNSLLASKIMLYFGISNKDTIEKVINNVNKLITEAGIDLKEENGIYKFPIKNTPFIITYGIVDDKLLITSNNIFFDGIIAGKEKLRDKVKSEKLKKAIDSRDAFMFMHLDIVDFMNMFSTIFSTMSRDENKATLFNPFKELLDEINLVAYDKGKYFDGLFELTFKSTDFLKKLYKMISEFK